MMSDGDILCRHPRIATYRMPIFYHLDRKRNYLRPDWIMDLLPLEIPPERAEEGAHLCDLFPKGVSNHGLMYACGYAPAGPEQDREFLLEHIRQEHYSDYPSRFACYYACGSLEDARLLKRAGKRGDQLWGEAIIWKVKAVEEFRADMTWLTPVFHLDPDRNAHRYWQQAASPRPFWECLLTPPVHVIEEIV
jgi:Protein of unknown function (DUF2441)